MTRSSQPKGTAYLKAIRNTGHHSEEIARKSTCVQATTRALEAPDLQTFIKVIDECRQMIKITQERISLLSEQNSELEKALATLAQKEAQARHLGHHDVLTGLPNRSLLQDRFHQAIAQAERRHNPLGLIMVDLDNFKHVNDKLGHACGDKLLQSVATRLIKAIRGADTACRYGGDEFVIMLPLIDNPHTANALAVEIGGRLSEPYILDGHKIHMAVSVGLAVYPGDGKNFDELIRQADFAMYHAKTTGTGISIVKLPKEDSAPIDMHNPFSPNSADHQHETDLFTQH